MASQHRAPIDVPNLRDLGGLPTQDGRRTRPGLLFRAPALTMPDQHVQLRDLALATVCDLRSHSERGRNPNQWCFDSPIDLLELDILQNLRGTGKIWERLRADPSARTAREIMVSTYRAFPEAAAAHLRSIVERIAEGRLPMLIHCTAGKDRTGFVCAMLLLGLGVEIDAVIADYLMSDTRMGEQSREATAAFVRSHVGSDIPEAALTVILGVRREFLDASLEEIEQRFGSVAAYLESAGISPEMLSRAAARLLS
ncbi:MAG: protein-tyrosine phosphatase [Alphaproteobacteria bacterium]|nr:protein-tyrosine phosphatase [Alphaproteobacteria bacterium]